MSASASSSALDTKSTSVSHLTIVYPSSQALSPEGKLHFPHLCTMSKLSWETSTQESFLWEKLSACVVTTSLQRNLFRNNLFCFSGCEGIEKQKQPQKTWTCVSILVQSLMTLPYSYWLIWSDPALIEFSGKTLICFRDMAGQGGGERRGLQFSVGFGFVFLLLAVLDLPAAALHKSNWLVGPLQAAPLPACPYGQV